jgi:hypothetical protein
MRRTRAVQYVAAVALDTRWSVLEQHFIDEDHLQFNVRRGT